jgi:small subunit ribosomal protein YMR-31
MGYPYTFDNYNRSIFYPLTSTVYLPDYSIRQPRDIPTSNALHHRPTGRRGYPLSNSHDPLPRETCKLGIQSVFLPCISLLFFLKHFKSSHTELFNAAPSLPAEPHAPSPHPAAPQDIVDNFQSFLSKFQSTSTSADSPSSNPKGQSLGSSAKGQVRDHPSKDASPSASSSSSSTSTTQVVNKGSGRPSDFDTYFMAPTKLWRPKMFSPEELEAVQVSPRRPL